MRALIGSMILAFGTGCGGMHIRTDRPDAEIYLDGMHVGTGEAEVGRLGPPRTATIRVEYRGRVVEQEVERSFTAGTVAIGAFTVYTGLVWAWFFPEEVRIELRDGWSLDPWNPSPDAHNPWLEPPGS